VNPAAYAPVLSIPGAGAKTKECVLEFLMSNPAGAAVLDTRGNTSYKQSCTDGDATCDFDDVPNQCTFQVAVCFNVVDSRFPDCTSDRTDEFEVLRPTANDALNPNKPGDDVNRANLLAVAGPAGPLVVPNGTDNDCVPTKLVVPMKISGSGPRSTSKKIKVRSTVKQTLFGKDPRKIKDSDVLKMTCNP
jgi:hypothetical protein